MAEVWDSASLTRLTDEVRACLAAGSGLTEKQVETVETVMQKLLDDESAGKVPDLVLIAQTRFELFVRDIVNAGMQRGDSRFSNLESIMTKCFGLQKSWRKHFRMSYFVAVIDEERQRILEDETLNHVVLNPKDGTWSVTEPKPESHSHTEGSLEFKPGQWWLNLACCYRDGIVGSMVDDLTKGPYGVTAIPLLLGEEIESSIPDCFTYSRVGPIQDMYVSIMSQLGQKNVRILRGCKLKSRNAPKGGIRYDGLYTPIEYSHNFDATTNLYGVRILFKRTWGTPPAESLAKIPSHSQMDDWKLYLLMAINEKEVSRPKRLRMIPQGMEERGSDLLKSAEFLAALKTGSPSELRTPGPSPMAPKNKMVAQGMEERGEFFKSSDFTNLMNEGPDSSPAASIKSSSPAPPKPGVKPKNKLVAQGNEARGDFMRSADFMDMLNGAPPGEDMSPAPPAKRIQAPATNRIPPAAKSPAISVKGVGGGASDDRDKEPVITKKRVKARDPYDIDAMMDDIENDEEFAEEPAPKKGPKSQA